MRILVAWDDAAEADLLSLYLATGENEVAAAKAPADVLPCLRAGDVDAVLLALTFPTAPESFSVFTQILEHYPGVPGSSRLPASGDGQLAALHGPRAALLRDP